MPAAVQRFLVVEDDPTFSRVLTRGLRARGFEAALATTAGEALHRVATAPPDCVVLDLKLGDTSALPLIRPLCTLATSPRICLLTGFASIATAVEAIKLGAHQYLTKPAHVDEILAALGIGTPAPATAVPAHREARPAPSLVEVEWRHIVNALRECRGNVSRTAERLGMHRRTLQRKISGRTDSSFGELLARFRQRSGPADT